MLKWNNSFRLGIKTMDEHHESIFKHVNALRLSLEGDRWPEEAPIMLDFFRDYAIHHLEYEESLMESSQFEGIEAHKHWHADFVDHCTDLRIHYISEDKESAIKTLEYFENWLTEHIILEDSKIVAHLAKQNLLEIYTNSP